MIKFITKHFWIFLLLGIILGLFVSYSSLLSPYIMYLLMIVLFLTSLKISLKETITSFKKPLLLIYLVFLVLIATPIIMYLLVKNILPSEYSLAVLILVAMPAGMATPAYSDIFKGNRSLSLVLAVTSSLIAPITIPLILFLITGAKYNLPILKMFYSLALMLVLPFVLATIIRRFTKKIIRKTQKYYSALSIIILIFVIAGGIAKIRETFFQILPEIIFPFIILFLITILLTLIGYYAIPRATKRTKISSALSTAYVNASLALVFTATFFGPKVLLLVTMQQFIGNFTVIGFGYLVRKN